MADSEPTAAASPSGLRSGLIYGASFVVLVAVFAVIGLAWQPGAIRDHRPPRSSPYEATVRAAMSEVVEFFDLDPNAIPTAEDRVRMFAVDMTEPTRDAQLATADRLIDRSALLFGVTRRDVCEAVMENRKRLDDAGLEQDTVALLEGISLAHGNGIDDLRREIARVASAK